MKLDVSFSRAICWFFSHCEIHMLIIKLPEWRSEWLHDKSSIIKDGFNLDDILWEIPAKFNEHTEQVELNSLFSICFDEKYKHACHAFESNTLFISPEEKPVGLLYVYRLRLPDKFFADRNIFSDTYTFKDATVTKDSVINLK